MKASIVLLTTLLALPLIAQESRAPRPLVIPPPTRPQPPQAGEENTITENITLRLQGPVFSEKPRDISLTGVGPSFYSDQVENDSDPMHCEYRVVKSETGYQVSYALSVRLKTPIGEGSKNYEYRDVSIKGTVVCRPGQTTVLARSGDKPPITLTLTEGSDTSKGPNSASPKPE